MPDLKDLPSIDRLTRSPALEPVIVAHGLEIVKRELRALQSRFRSTGVMPEWATDPAGYAAEVPRRLRGLGYRPVFNLTGTILHTNLGRALLSDEVYQSVAPLVTRPMNLEYDLDSGERGDREKVVEEKLKVLTGAEAATVVNNGAAALLLVLNSLALGREVPVSRGELIEIGGSFRLPDIMARSGCVLREVGATNRTHPGDFEAAIGPSTGLLLKVHPSNYQISGFTRVVDLPELAALGAARGLPVCVDLGSGTLVDLRRFGLPHEPMPQEALAQGADLVTFSGDKLLGATQAGIVVGRAPLVAQLKRNPLKRALRPGKLTLAFLERILTLYETPETLGSALPLLRTLTTPLGVLEARGHRISALLAPMLPGYRLAVVSSECQLGSGSLPEQRIPSVAVRIDHPRERELETLRTRLRELPVPAIARLQQGALWLDLRGAEPLEELLLTFAELGRTR